MSGARSSLWSRRAFLRGGAAAVWLSGCRRHLPSRILDPARVRCVARWAG